MCAKVLNGVKFMYGKMSCEESVSHFKGIDSSIIYNLQTVTRHLLTSNSGCFQILIQYNI
jgi:hypothetical protein